MGKSQALKGGFCLMILFVLICLFPMKAFADEDGLSESQQEFFSQAAGAAGADELPDSLPDEARSLMEEAGIPGFSPSEFLKSPRKAVQMAGRLLKEQAKKPFQVLGMILGALLLCALLDCTRETFTGGELGQVFGAAVTLFLAASAVLPAMDCIKSCVETVRGCSQFMVTFVPVYASVVTACGLPATGSIYYLFLFSAAQIVSSVVSNYLVPLAGVYLALNIAAALSPQIQIQPLLDALKKFVCWVLSFLLAGFVALLTMQNAVSSGMDAMTLKTSKMLVSSLIPVVGGALSDAVSVASGCMRVVKSAVGVYGIAAAACIFLPVFFRTAGWYMALSIGAAAGEMLSVKQAVPLLKAGASLMGILMAVLCLYMLLILVSTTILLMTGMGF